MQLLIVEFYTIDIMKNHLFSAVNTYTCWGVLPSDMIEKMFEIKYLPDNWYIKQ